MGWGGDLDAVCLMNYQPIKQLIRIRHGSHLYGTSTPNSDLDYKGVFLPSGEDIILGRVPRVIDKSTNTDETKNTKDDIDDTSYPLHKFFEMLVKGDTTATEILFAHEAAIELITPEWEIIRNAAPLFINRECKGFVGYCRQQANKYGIKGSRMAACKGIVDLLAKGMEEFGGKTKLGELDPVLEAFCGMHEFSELVPIMSHGQPIMHLDVVNRKVGYTTTIKDAHAIYARIYENYGERARMAMTNEGVDWKAMSHAVRVSRQALELLETGKVTFPRPDADELLRIKLGKLPFSEVGALLEELVEQVEAASETSTLPEESDQVAIDLLVLHLYGQQVKES
jgi:hypothetical protein